MSSEFKSACRGCGKPIVWAVTEEGKRIPLDPIAPVYELIGNGILVRRCSNGLVSHFSTCSKANDFSASRKRRLDQGELALEGGP